MSGQSAPTPGADAPFFAATGVRKLVQPIPRDRLTRRFGQLLVGLVLYGFSMAIMIRAGLGLDPWDVFHQGLTEKVNLSFGLVVIIMSVVVLLIWIPLRQKPGVGTIANAIIVGAATDLGLFLLPAIDNLALAIVAMVLSVPLNALAGALYLGAGLGPGPRDGLMTGLVAKGVGSVMVVRTGIEGTVLIIGWLMGGTVFVGTVLYAVAIGPCLHLLMPIFRVGKPPAVTDPELAAAQELAEGR